MTDQSEQTALPSTEVEALPEGTPVIVIWSGGNGPHRYTIAVQGEQRYAASEGFPDPFFNPLTFVGQERFHTRVWLDDSDRNPE